MENKGIKNVGLSSLKKNTFSGEGIDISNLNNLANNQNEIPVVKAIRGKYNTKERSERKAVKLKIDADAYKYFLDLRFNIYNINNDKGNISNASFIKLLMKNLEEYFNKKYKGVHDIDENDIAFLKSAGRKVNIYEYYPFDPANSISTSITLEIEVIHFFYKLAITYFYNERRFLHQYSLALFFYDILGLISNKTLEVKYYNNKEIADWIKTLK